MRRRTMNDAAPYRKTNVFSLSISKWVCLKRGDEEGDEGGERGKGRLNRMPLLPFPPSSLRVYYVIALCKWDFRPSGCGGGGRVEIFVRFLPNFKRGLLRLSSFLLPAVTLSIPLPLPSFRPLSPDSERSLVLCRGRGEGEPTRFNDFNWPLPPPF